MNELIESHFEDKDFDIRKKRAGYSRFMDQKVTPDVLSFIADCILNLPNADDFTVKDIWELDYFIKNTQAIFGKPSPSNETSFSEYNKFIGQPLKTLAYSEVLQETKKGNTNHYSINNEELLEYISLNERGSLDFLIEYITKVITDSGFIASLENYRTAISRRFDPGYFKILKTRFHRFMLGNTEINGVVEINRIFPKIINPYAVKYGAPGSVKGRITEYPLTFSELMYNRTNFRDLKKSKGVSRQEAAITASEQNQKEKYHEYRITKAVALIKRKYTSSEIRDQWANGSATHVHHIFPQSQHPEFAAYTENLIKLTPEQHYSHAHPNARTQEIDDNYQIQCLLAKCESIEQSIVAGEFMYSKNNFIYMLDKLLGLDIQEEAAFEEIKEKLRAILATA